jgi:hypothetical protein
MGGRTKRPVPTWLRVGLRSWLGECWGHTGGVISALWDVCPSMTPGLISGWVKTNGIISRFTSAFGTPCICCVLYCITCAWRLDCVCWHGWTLAAALYGVLVFAHNVFGEVPFHTCLLQKFKGLTGFASAIRQTIVPTSLVVLHSSLILVRV